MPPEVSALDSECALLGRECAQARLRLDDRGPEPYKAAFCAYRGPKQFPSYFERKRLSLRLSAVKRGMVVDPTVTAEFLARITDGRCPVTHEELDTVGRSPSNPSVDRLVNEVTYIAGNICVLSMRANRAKGNKSFEEVARIAEAGEDAGGLAAVEWMRLTSLMYGAWSRALKQGDPHLLPLAAIPGRGLFMSTSQVVQLLLTRQCATGALAQEANQRWLTLTSAGGGEPAQFEHLWSALSAALLEEPYPGNAWLREPVFVAFDDWYNSCHTAVIPCVEGLLQDLEARRADPVGSLLWPEGSRYQH